MADATQSKASSNHLEDVISKLAASQLSMSSKIDDLLHRMSQLEISHQPPQTPPSPLTGNAALPVSERNHRMKLDVPRFDDSDPTGWIFKITQFF